MTQHRVVEAKPVDQLVERVLGHFNVHQHVMRLDQILDRVRQLAATPVFQTMDSALVAFDQRLVALDHGRHLLALVRVDNEYDYIVTHGNSLWMRPVPTAPTPTPSVIPDAYGGDRTPSNMLDAPHSHTPITYLTHLASTNPRPPT